MRERSAVAVGRAVACADPTHARRIAPVYRLGTGTVKMVSMRLLVCVAVPAVAAVDVGAGDHRQLQSDAECAQRLAKLTRHVNSVCCSGGVSCEGGSPDTCTADCAALWMPFYRMCSEFAADSLGELAPFSQMCIETTYGADGLACDATYLTAGLRDTALACGCARPYCGMLETQLSATNVHCAPACAAEFETVYARCGEYIRNPASNLDAAGWDSYMAACQDTASAPAVGGSCEEQCAAHFPHADQSADVCACVFGCHASEGGQDSAACVATCDTQCDDDDECVCACGSAGTCSECTFGDQCESPCGVGCSILVRRYLYSCLRQTAAHTVFTGCVCSRV